MALSLIRTFERILDSGQSHIRFSGMKQRFLNNCVAKLRWFFFVALTLLLCFLSWPALFTFTWISLFSLGKYSRWRAIPDNLPALAFNTVCLYTVSKIKVKIDVGAKVSIGLLILISWLLSANSVMWTTNIFRESGLGWFANFFMPTGAPNPWLVDLGTVIVATCAILAYPSQKIK